MVARHAQILLKRAIIDRQANPNRMAWHSLVRGTLREKRFRVSSGLRLVITRSALVCEPAKMTLTGPVESLRDQPVLSRQSLQIRKARQHALDAALFVERDTISTL
jgi:hypothetical protein